MMLRTLNFNNKLCISECFHSGNINVLSFQFVLTFLILNNLVKGYLGFQFTSNLNSELNKFPDMIRSYPDRIIPVYFRNIILPEISKSGTEKLLCTNSNLEQCIPSLHTQNHYAY